MKIMSLAMVAAGLGLALPSGASAEGVSPPAVHGRDTFRTASGLPDIGGFWSNSTLTPLTRKSSLGERATFTPAEVKAMEQAVVQEIADGNKPTPKDAPVNASNGLESRPEFVAAGGDVGGYNRGWLDPGSLVMRVAGEPRTSLLTTQNGQIPPPRPGAPTAGFRKTSYDNPENLGLGERCMVGFGRNAGPPMFPNGFYNNNYNIVQTPDAVVIQVEMVHDTRIVRLHSQHRADNLRPWFGDSIGWWDGDTLVVETNHIPQSQALGGAWRDLTVTERFTRVAKDRLRYQFTINDPTVWAEPWGGEYEFSSLRGVIYEYACHEGNYALPGILAGARAQERDASHAVVAKSSLGLP